MAQTRLDFPSDAFWLNTADGWSMADLEGRVVLLALWSTVRADGLETLDAVRRAAEGNPEWLTPVSVHCPDFPEQSHKDVLRKAVIRLGVDHALVDDPQREVMAALGVESLPAFALVSADGKVEQVRQGRDCLAELSRLAAEEADAAARTGNSPAAASPLYMEGEIRHDETLFAPSHVLVTGRGEMYLSDTGNHRLIRAKLAPDKPVAKILSVIGSGPGLADGPAAEAGFFRPRGMAESADGTCIYVADSGNGAVRRVDADSGEVRTLAGPGALASPWDMVTDKDTLLVSEAAGHRISRLDPSGGGLEVFAGCGTEGFLDASISEAAFAQPCGLALHEGVLYVADSLNSVVRRVEEGRVETLGCFENTRLVSGVAISPHTNDLYAADSLQNRILCRNGSGEWEIFIGKGRGYVDGVHARFFEPHGLAATGECLLAADTGNHAVRIVDLNIRLVDSIRLI